MQKSIKIKKKEMQKTQMPRELSNRRVGVQVLNQPRRNVSRKPLTNAGKQILTSKSPARPGKNKLVDKKLDKVVITKVNVEKAEEVKPAPEAKSVLEEQEDFIAKMRREMEEVRVERETSEKAR